MRKDKLFDMVMQEGKQMRKVIVYASVHHGNTEKLVKSIAEECQVDLINAVKQPDEEDIKNAVEFVKGL